MKRSSRYGRAPDCCGAIVLTKRAAPRMHPVSELGCCADQDLSYGWDAGQYSVDVRRFVLPAARPLGVANLQHTE
jgi:hypothetical protein